MAENESRSMTEIRYGSQAELFPTRGRMSKPRPMGYRRFARAADAIRFAIEDLAPEHLQDAYLVVDEKRFDSDGIRRLYEDTAYPLVRRAAPVR
jgi:hypothetical protein